LPFWFADEIAIIPSFTQLYVILSQQFIIEFIWQPGIVLANGDGEQVVKVVVVFGLVLLKQKQVVFGFAYYLYLARYMAHREPEALCRPAKPGAGVVHNLHGLKQGHREIFLYALYGTALEQIVGGYAACHKAVEQLDKRCAAVVYAGEKHSLVKHGDAYLSEGQASRQRLRG